MLCKELMILCSALGSGGLVSRRTTGRRSEDHFQPAGRPAGRFGSRSARSGGGGGGGQNGCWLPSGGVGTACDGLDLPSRFEGCRADGIVHSIQERSRSPDLAHLVTVEKV